MAPVTAAGARPWEGARAPEQLPCSSARSVPSVPLQRVAGTCLELGTCPPCHSDWDLLGSGSAGARWLLLLHLPNWQVSWQPRGLMQSESD